MAAGGSLPDQAGRRCRYENCPAFQAAGVCSDLSPQVADLRLWKARPSDLGFTAWNFSKKICRKKNKPYF
jgi:hypothetical protein